MIAKNSALVIFPQIFSQILAQIFTEINAVQKIPQIFAILFAVIIALRKYYRKTKRKYLQIANKSAKKTINTYGSLLPLSDEASDTNLLDMWLTTFETSFRFRIGN